MVWKYTPRVAVILMLCLLCVPAQPINNGMPSDASPAAMLECQLKSCQLKKILDPFVHRKDSSVLRETLPPMQQVVLHVRQTKAQSNLYKALKRFERRKGITSYLTRYHLSRPIHNHPACLLMKPSESASEDSEDSDDELTNRDGGKSMPTKWAKRA